jgi:hypothetical protein
MGLRETIPDTPTFVFPSEVLDVLVKIMRTCLHDNNYDAFQKFIFVARKRLMFPILQKNLFSISKTW